MKPQRFPLLASFFLGLLPISAVAQLGQVARTQDARLEQHVTFTSPRIQIGDLLRRLSAQFGIEIRCRDSDGSADAELALWIRDLPLVDLLDGLQSLLSYKGAKWDWMIGLEKQSPTYVLLRTRPAQEFPITLKREVEKRFLAHVDLMIAAARMNPESRAQIVGSISDSMLQQNDEVATGLAKQERIWAGLRLFASAIPVEQRQELLLNGATVQVPLKSLPAESEEFVLGLHQKGSKNALMKAKDGSLVTVPPPTKVFIHATRSGPFVTPSLFIELENSGGYAYAGGVPLDRGFRSLLRSMWMQAGDRGDDPRLATPIPLRTPVLREEAIRPLAGRIAEIGRGCRLNVLARLPADLKQDPGSGSPDTIGKFLQRLFDDRVLMSKWRNGLLLLDSPGWFWETDMLPPWKIIKAIREKMEGDHPRASLAEMVEVTIKLSPAQTAHAAEDLQSFRHLNVIRPLISLSAIHRRKLLASSGLRADQTTIEALRQIPTLDTTLQQFLPTAVRLLERRVAESDQPTERVELEFLHSDGRWLAVWGYSL